jgi:hypothetical protein
MIFRNDCFLFDDSQFSFISFYLNGKEFTDSALDDFIAKSESILAYSNPVVVLYKTENFKYLFSEHRIKLGLWMKANIEPIKKNVLAVGYHVNSVFGKMLLNGIFLVQKPVTPYIVSSDEAEILAFFEKYLEEAQVAVQ